MTEARDTYPDRVASFELTSCHSPLQSSVSKVADYLAKAIREVAHDMGGEELQTKVSELLHEDDSYFCFPALNLLEETEKGAFLRVFVRSAKIQNEAIRSELTQLPKPTLLHYGRATLEGVATFNVFGQKPIRDGNDRY